MSQPIDDKRQGRTAFVCEMIFAFESRNMKYYALAWTELIANGDEANTQRQRKMHQNSSKQTSKMRVNKLK